MNEFLLIRRAVADDAATIVDFNRAMARETEGKELAVDVIRSGVEGLLRHPEYGFYLLAEVKASPVGSLLVTFEWSDWRNGLLWWIQSVYVHAAWRRRSVYRQLYKTVKTLAAEEDQVRGFRLYVEKDNGPAQKTYSALGMREAPYRIFEELYCQ